MIHLLDGKWGAIEVKLGADEATLESAAETLRKFSETVDTEKMRKPEFLMIVSGVSKFTYRRKDGIYVVPVGCLGV